MVRLDPAGKFERVPLVAGHQIPRRSKGCCSTSRRRRSTTSSRTGSSRRSSRWTCSTCRPSTSWSSNISFPAYTGLQPRTVDPGGDIAAIKGTEVRLKITPTMATPGGRVLLNENESAPLTKEADGTLTGNFTVNAQGFYKIELEGPHGGEGERVAAVHDRRAVRRRADRALQQAGPRHARRARSKRCSPKCAPTTTSASSSCRCSTR